MKTFIPPLLFLIAGGLLIAGSLWWSPQTTGELDLKITKTPLIMPAAHNVYANPEALDGKYFLFKSLITNNTGRELEDVEVHYEIPGYIDRTELKKIKSMLPGQSAVIACYPRFDPSITQKSNESREQVQLDIRWTQGGKEEVLEEDFAVKILGRNDYAYTCIPTTEVSGWADIFDNNDLLACYVTPNDPVVRYYTQTIQEKILKGEQAVVVQDPREAMRVMGGIYEATRKAHMVYSGTKGIPQSTDDVQSMVQSVRLPREVITGNTGLCIELSCLYASVLSATGLDAVIYLVPGHAFPGFRLNGQFYAIEATQIGGEGMGSIGSVEDAFKVGEKNLKEFMQGMQMGDGRYALVDIHQLQQKGVVAMDLPDDNFSKEKIDKLAANFSSSERELLANNHSNNSRQPTSPSSNQFAGRTPGPLSVGIPSGWQFYNNPVPQIPIWTSIVESPDQMANAGIFDVPAQSLDHALQILQQYLGQSGSQVNYQINGNQIQGITSSAYGQFRWQGFGQQTGNGFRLTVVGANTSVYGNYSATLQQMLKSIQ